MPPGAVLATYSYHLRHVTCDRERALFGGLPLMCELKPPQKTTRRSKQPRNPPQYWQALSQSYALSKRRAWCAFLLLPNRVPTDIRLGLYSAAAGFSRLWMPRSSAWSYCTSPAAVEQNTSRQSGGGDWVRFWWDQENLLRSEYEANLYPTRHLPSFPLACWSSFSCE